MAWTKARWANPCSEIATLTSDYQAMCRRKAGHGGKWHKDGEVRWRVAKPQPEPPTEPHLHTLHLRVDVALGKEPLGRLTVPLPCGIDGHRQVFSREYLVNGTPVLITGDLS